MKYLPPGARSPGAPRTAVRAQPGHPRPTVPRARGAEQNPTYCVAAAARAGLRRQVPCCPRPRPRTRLRGACSCWRQPPRCTWPVHELFQGARVRPTKATARSGPPVLPFVCRLTVPDGVLSLLSQLLSPGEESRWVAHRFTMRGAALCLATHTLPRGVERGRTKSTWRASLAPRRCPSPNDGPVGGPHHPQMTVWWGVRSSEK